MSACDMESVLAQITSSSTHPAITNIIRKAADADILPVLKFDRWVGLSPQDFLRILPALRLASQIMRSPRGLQFFYARARGNTEVTFDDRDINQLRFYRDDRTPNAHLPPDHAAIAHTYLNDLVMAVTLAFEPRPDETEGDCEPLSHDRIHWSQPGIRSKVVMNEKNLHRLDLMQTLGPAVLKQWVIMATTLCHELSHAFNMAFEGQEDHEMFFEDDTFCELGHAFEKFVIGGQVLVERGPAGEAMMVMREWSSSHMSKVYAAGGTYVPTVSRASEPDPLDMTVVQDSWTERLFNDERFWDETLVRDGGQSLQIPVAAFARRERVDYSTKLVSEWVRATGWIRG
ncbi:unnamed protein product [Zymoseptoria tritici ST99CH_3D7]|uniref:Uncharacterized protein n=1 Tax=Zymoseptoria tritici (strain ST99CH_3D7) TaxID=1276538 RepID=A0A1X7RH22_ZYMT9|nr:unnamed protein product [Zymoseptoria tritici ST99CH_3D7]